MLYGYLQLASVVQYIERRLFYYLLRLQIYQYVLYSVLFCSAYPSSAKTTSTLAVVNKVHWCVAIVVRVGCDKLYFTVETGDDNRQSSIPKPDIDRKLRFLPHLALWSLPECCHNVWCGKTRMVQLTGG